MALPSVLIFGGIASFASPLLDLLLPPNGPPLVSFVRIADRASVFPSTIYIDPNLKKSIEKNMKLGLVEYKQSNLMVPATVKALFEPPEGKEPFTLVYDLTGERPYDRPEIMQITQTAALASILGQEASFRRVKAYCRILHPFSKSKGSKKEDGKEDKTFEPDGTRGIWWHEAARALAALPDLNLVLLRIGADYGPNLLGGVVLPRIVCGHIYKHLEEDMKLLWSADLKINTIHSADVALALHLASTWMSNTNRSDANKAYGVTLSPNATGSISSDSMKMAGEVSGAKFAGWKDTFKAPLFNIVDDGEATQEKIASAVVSFFGIKHDYYGPVTNLFAKLKMKDSDFHEMVEDANEMHVEAWTELLARDGIINSPLTPYLDSHEFGKNSINLDGSRARKVLGFKPSHPSITQEEVKKIVIAWQAQNLWPKI